MEVPDFVHELRPFLPERWLSRDNRESREFWKALTRQLLGRPNRTFYMLLSFAHLRRRSRWFAPNVNAHQRKHPSSRVIRPKTDYLVLITLGAFALILASESGLPPCVQRYARPVSSEPYGSPTRQSSVLTKCHRPRGGDQHAKKRSGFPTRHTPVLPPWRARVLNTNRVLCAHGLVSAVRIE